MNNAYSWAEWGPSLAKRQRAGSWPGPPGIGVIRRHSLQRRPLAPHIDTSDALARSRRDFRKQEVQICRS
jgi:hypothetical protein